MSPEAWPTISTKRICSKRSNAAQYLSSPKLATSPPPSWSNLISWSTRLSVAPTPRSLRRKSASKTTCSVSESPHSNNARASSPEAEGKKPGAEAPRRGRFDGGGLAMARSARSSAPLAAAAAASWSKAATGMHCQRNHVGGRPISKWCCHIPALARMASSQKRLKATQKGLEKPMPPGIRSLLISTFTKPPMVVGKNECRRRMEKRLLMRFSSMPMTSIFSLMPMMESCTPTSCAMSKRLYNNVCLAREQKCSNRSRTMTTALACWKRLFKICRSHSMVCSKEALPRGASGNWPATWLAKWRTHSASVPYL
mmetsp:Transcript_80419/g.232287  ORF Transcript_80419/g.232287 Transcript_80419/m.232287 type:complete len:312 (-) Transcript_80419:290-1225(-)